MREVNVLELKFREQAVEYFKNCSEKYGECEDEIIFSDDPWGEFCIKRFHAWGMEH